ncbi:hypothetical protein LCGC14_1514660 [marine sediment metagenome]|uniref:Uncharacterized protein n=1 Tax=marine sediment metagenome TaxID=412755 RepID=A0A0F9LFW5_9ZZZZ
MADELSLRFSMSYDKDGAKVSRKHSISVDVAGDVFAHEIQPVDTIEEELHQGTWLGNPGYLYIVNLDDTNFVELGITTGVYTVKLLAGEVALFRVNGATIYVKADTAICHLEYILIEL